MDDHSQNGEFSVFLECAKPQPGGFIVDVGAKDKVGSNSFDLMKIFCWRGLLIEGNPARWETIERDFNGLDFSLERSVVSEHGQEADFHISWISSLDPAMVLLFGPIQKIARVKTKRLHQILENHAVPHNFDLLSLDIEGSDLGVLTDLLSSSDYFPEWIWIEARPPQLLANGIISSRYEIVATTLPNTLLRRK